MTKCTEHAPKLHPTVTECGAFIAGSVYAALLTTKFGYRMDREHTWFTVMIGVLMTLGWLAIEDRKAAQRAFVYFVCSGLPIIVRSLYLQSRFNDALIDREIGHGKKTT